MSAPREAAKLFSFSLLTSHKQPFQGVSRLCYMGDLVLFVQSDLYGMQRTLHSKDTKG